MSAVWPLTRSSSEFHAVAVFPQEFFEFLVVASAGGVEDFPALRRLGVVLCCLVLLLVLRGEPLEVLGHCPVFASASLLSGY